MASWEYDREADALYVTLSDEPIEGQDVLGDGIVVDIAASQVVHGVEVLGVSYGWTPAAVFARYLLTDDQRLLLEVLASHRLDRGVAVRTQCPEPVYTGSVQTEGAVSGRLVISASDQALLVAS